MTDIKKKEEELKEEGINPFVWRFAQLGVTMRAKARDVLHFDSEVSNIDYVYVDTQQYKNLLGACCDATGIAFTCDTSNEEVQVQTDNKGVLLFIAQVKMTVTFSDPWEIGKSISMSAAGLGVSRGSGYALGIAQTNAMRNIITNGFLLPTSDRESDDVRENIKPTTYLTDEAKAEKRAELLERTKTNSEFATIAYGMILYQRIEETLSKDIPDDFRDTLVKFKESKFKGNKPIPREDNEDLWIVKRTAAMQIMSDLDGVS